MNTIRSIVYKNIDPWTEQRPDATVDQIFSEICHNLDNDVSCAVEENGSFSSTLKTDIYAKYTCFQNASLIR